MLWFGLISYCSAALLCGIASIVVIAGNTSSGRARLLAATIAMSGAWAAGLAVSWNGVVFSPFALASLDAFHLFVWTVCLLSWLEPPSARKWLLGTSAAMGVFGAAASWPDSPFSSMGSNGYPALVLMALIGLLSVEQVYRNAQGEARRHLKWLCLGAGGVFAIDLFVYSHAALVGTPQPAVLVARGFAETVMLPLILIGARRQSGPERELFVSRHVMFYTASLFSVGAYLLAMGLIAYVIRAFDREWSFPLDLAFLAGGIGVLVAILFSANIRARFRAFIIKHFYRSKYDYREEWLRLTKTLSRTGDLRESAAHGLEGMARIIGSERGDLWVERDEQRYEWLVSLGDRQPTTMRFDRTHSLVEFLASSGWVIDSEEYAEQPDRYGTAFGHPDEGVLPQDSLVVPLDRQGHLQGFVMLSKPAGLRSLNFEDHDLLKTVGRQVAAVLAQALMQEKLAETLQFEALSRLSAFLMHDLKNIVAEQELVLANAQRFRHRADFIDDAFATIRGGTERIKKVLDRLASASRAKPPPGRVDVSKVLMAVRSQCADRQPVPEMDLQVQAAWVRMDRDELMSVLLHVVRNAQDATPPDGHINIGVSRGPTELLITVSDTGCGMDSAFVRDRLFRPFDTTKGSSGMGIGAYQARHIVRRAGGELDVSSVLGKGTTFTMRLPTAT